MKPLYKWIRTLIPAPEWIASVINFKPSKEELKQTYSLVRSLYVDPETKLDFLRLVKRKYPHALTPELDAAHEAILQRALKSHDSR